MILITISLIDEIPNYYNYRMQYNLNQFNTSRHLPSFYSYESIYALVPLPCGSVMKIGGHAALRGILSRVKN